MELVASRNNDDPTAAHPAPYGSACANCVRAKSKCILRAGESCERCHRLGKECSPSSQVRKRGSKRTGQSRRTNLEDKLSDLVTLLQAQQSSSANPPVVVEGPLSNEFPILDSRHVNPAIPTPDTIGSRTRSQASRSPISSAAETSTRAVELTTVEANDILTTFRSHHLNTYPFTYLPVALTVEELQRERPFLWMSMRAICARSTALHLELGTQVREALARKAVVEGERSMDLLQGLLAHMAWSQHFARSANPFLGMLSGIARSLVYDLRLDEPSGDPPPGVFGCPGPSLTQLKAMKTMGATNEERRALLSCFTTSSSVSALLQYESMHWSPQLEAAASSLEQCPEWSGDSLLASIARISRVVNDAIKTSRHTSNGMGSTLLHVKPLQMALENVKSALSPYAASNSIVLSYIYNAEVHIHEAIIFQKPPGPLDQHYDFKRYEYLQNCLVSAKSCVENFFTFDAPQFASLNFYIMLHSLHSLQTIYRLIILSDQNWDRSTVQQMADVVGCLEHIAQTLDKVHAHLRSEDRTGEQSVWSAGAERLRSAIPHWRAGIDRVERQQPGIDVAEDMEDMTMSFLDDAWITDFFSPTWNI